MATYRKRGNSYAFTIRRKNLLSRPIYLTFDSLEEGLEKCAQIEALLDQGIIPEFLKDQVENRQPENIEELINAFLNENIVSLSDKPILTMLSVKIGETSLSSVSYTWLENWIARMKRIDNLSPTTIKHRVGALARCFDWGLRKNLIGNNPARSLPKRYASYTEADRIAIKDSPDKEVKVEILRDRRLFAEEEQRIRNVYLGNYMPSGERKIPVNDDMRLIFELALETGMRLSEIIGITRSMISLEQSTIFLSVTKNKQLRQVGLSTKAIKLAAECLGRHSDERLFEIGGKTPDEESNRVSRHFARVCKHAQVHDFRFHDLRHEYTSRLYERTSLSDVEIAKQLGWKSMKMALRYANLRGSTIASKLW